MIKLAIDAMGGDLGPAAVIPGIAQASRNNRDVFFIIYGKEAALRPLIAQHLSNNTNYRVVNSDTVIPNDMLPSVALRQGRNSSMRLAVEAIKAGEAAAVISSGNTGAYMAISKVLLRTVPGITRPAIAKQLPTQNNASLMLDLGANVECTPMQLVQFALMGQIYVQDVLKVNAPSVALLNIGSEEQKGNATLQMAHQMLRALHSIENYAGYVEGDAIFTGKHNVIVTDGFTGNVALKTAEGTYKIIQHTLKNYINSAMWSRIGAMLCMPAFKKLKQRFDPNVSNGAPLLGLRGIAVKSHGGADAHGFAYAIKAAIDMVQADVCAHLEKGLLQQQASLEQIVITKDAGPTGKELHA